MRTENGSPLTAVEFNQPFLGLEGTYVENGWSVSIGESGTAIELIVDSGSGYLDNELIEVPSSTIQLSNGDSDYPRRDLIYVAPDSSISVLEGVPRPFSEDRHGNQLGFEEAPVPEPEDGSGLTGIPLYYVGVPPGAEDTSDLTSSALSDIRTFVNVGGSGTRSDMRYELLEPFPLNDGGQMSLPFMVGEGDTIILYEWGVNKLDDNGVSDAPEGVSVELWDYEGTVIHSEETPFTRNNDGIIQVEALGSEMGTPPHVFYLIVKNESGKDFNGFYENVGASSLCAQFRFEVIYG